MTTDNADGNDSELLFHYCGADALKSIVEKGELWLSSLNQSNDSMEGKLAHQRIREVLGVMKLSEDAKDHVYNMWDGISTLVECCGMCLSSDGDLLSQWRGYACNGAGFAVGFDPDRLVDLRFPSTYKPPVAWQNSPQLYEVAYKTSDQHRVVRSMIDVMEPHLKGFPGKMAIRKGLLAPIPKDGSDIALDALTRIGTTMFEWLPRAYSLKGEAFAEERESRLIYVAPLLPYVHEYRTRGHMVVPYVRALMRTGAQSPIASIWIGPTNPTPPHVVMSILKANDLGHVRVQQSGATYRG